jgi:hypothetical protein
MGYQRTFLDRDPDAPYKTQAVGFGIAVGAVATVLMVASQQIPGARHGLPWCVGVGVIVGVVTTRFVYGFARGAGGALLSFLQPSGATCPAPPQYSKIEALAAQGRVAEALAAFDAVARAEPANVAVRLQAAALHARSGIDPRRAESLLQEARRAPTCTPADDVHASQRLIDLYLGSLDDRGRALRELRRLGDRHATTAVGAQAREAIARLKANVVAGA